MDRAVCRNQVASGSAAALLLLLLPGCMTLMETGRARTLGGGEWEVGANLVLPGFSTRDRVPGGKPTGGVMPLPAPPVVATLGYGLTDRLELDLRAAAVEASAGAKLGLVRGEVLSLAVAPSVGWSAWGRPEQEQATRGNLSLIGGVTAGRLEVDLAAQAGWALDPAYGAPELLGGTVALHWRPPGRARRAGVAFTWLRYEAASPAPGDVRTADYVGAALVLSLAGSGPR